MFISADLFSKIFSLLSLVFIISLSIIVLKNSRKLTNKLFFLLTLILDVWVFASFMMISSTQDHQIVFWDAIVYTAVVFWPSLQYHFGLSVTYFNRHRRYILISAYFLSFFFLVSSQTKIFADGVFRYTWGAHTQANLLHHFFLGLFALYSLLFFQVMIKKYRQEKNRLEKKRILYFILGFCVLDFIGGTAFLPAYGIPFYPIFLATPLIFSLIIAYAIVYFGLMDIKLIMRRYFVYLLSLLFILLPIYVVLSIVYFFYFPHLLWVSLVLFVAALTTFPRLKKYLYRFANKYFFSSLYEINELIFSLNNRLRSSLDISQIFKSAIPLLSQAFHSKAVAVINYEAKSDKWRVLYNQGLSLPEKDIPINYKVIKDLFAFGQPINIDDLNNLLAKQRSIFNYLKKLDIELIVPISAGKEKLSSLMIFQAKVSGESYNAKDLKVLESVAAEIGMSLENALLYQSVTQFNVKLKKEISKATKQLQEQNKELKKLDAAKTEFIGIASHQLRTPLTGVRWFIELLLKNKEKNLNDKQVEFLSQASASNQRMIKLVNDLLDVSHIETGRKFDIIKITFDLNNIIEEVVKENIFLITTKELVIQNDLPKPLNIYADRDKMKQVWQNLISNATKYSGNKTEIRISFKEKPESLVFEVKDQGIGIPLDQQDKIFSKFFRANNASLQHSDGTGLGLYIAREIIRAHGGEMWFESKEGQGTSFFFQLPNKESTDINYPKSKNNLNKNNNQKKNKINKKGGTKKKKINKQK